MFIAHVSAGYLLTRSLRHVLNRTERLTILVGSLLPDVDLLLFYFRDGQSAHHHTYLTHRPVFWVAVVGLGLAAQRRHRSGRMLGVLGMAGLLHLILDAVGGAINWGWPDGGYHGAIGRRPRVAQPLGVVVPYPLDFCD
tara:strand:+ start:14842 stop:15258 length:417 start_codon:yes stop_codon:yes gene_type:complete